MAVDAIISVYKTIVVEAIISVSGTILDYI